MAKKKRAPAATRAKRQRAIDRSVREVAQAQRNLELKLKKHKRTISAMFYAV